MADEVAAIAKTMSIVENIAMIWKRLKSSSFLVARLLMLNSPLHV
jgi:hypothetical protein